MGLLLAVSVAALGGFLWIRSDGGHRFVERKLVEFVNAHIEGSVGVGRTSGSIFHDLTFEKVVVLNQRGQVAARAQAIYAKYALWGMLTHHPHLERVIVEGLDVHLAQIRDQQLDIRPLREWLRQHNKQLAIDELMFHDGRLDLRPTKSPLQVLDGVEARAFVWIANHHTQRFIDLKELKGEAELKRGPRHTVSAVGRFRMDPETRIDARAVVLRIGASRLEASGRLTKKRLDIDRLFVDAKPQLLHQLTPKENPPEAVLVKLTAHGPLDGIAVKADIHPGPGEITVDGKGDWEHKTATAVIDHHQLDGAYLPNQPPFVVSALVHASMRMFGKRIFVDGDIKNGEGMLKNVRFDRASFNGWIDHQALEISRVGMDVPGGSVSGHGHVGFKGDIDVQLRVNVNHPVKLLAAAKGKVDVPTPPKGKSLVSLDVELRKTRGEKKPHTHVRKVGFGKNIARNNNGSPL